MILQLGDKIVTKKPHPCGGTVWEIVRTGADYKMKCLTCFRVVMMTADEINKRVKRVMTEGENNVGADGSGSSRGA